MSIRYSNYVKSPNKEIEYTPDMIKKIIWCKENPIHFFEYIKVVHPDKGRIPFFLRKYQRNIIELIHNNRFFIGLLSRQSGKTITTAAYVLWYACFHSDKFIGIGSNKASSAKDFLSRIRIMYEELPVWLKPGVVEYNKYSIVFENGTRIETAATTTDAFRGRSVNCVIGESKVCFIDDHDNIYYTTIKKANSSNIINSNMNNKSDKKYYTVYSIKNLVNGKIYIGFHSTNDLDDGYLGSGKYIKRAVEKYKPENFEKEYIAILDNEEDAIKLEREIVNEEFVKRDDTYNISIGGNVCILFGKYNGFYGNRHSEETKKIISEKSKKYKHTKEAKMKISLKSKELW
ncbi:MAG: terminase large subunit domain-containing protein, partial [Atribacterota bacterium]